MDASLYSRLPLLLLVLALACSEERTDGTLLRWDASSGRLPEDGGAWERVLQYPGPAPEIADSVLRINSILCRDICDRVFYQRTRDLTVPRTFVVEASVRVVDDLHDPFTRDYGTGIGGVFSAGKAFLLLIGPGGYRFNHLRREFPEGCDTASAFHTYRIEADVAAEQVVLFIDGVEAARAQALPDPATYPRIWWGDFSRFGSATSEWGYLQTNCLSPQT